MNKYQILMFRYSLDRKFKLFLNTLPLSQFIKCLLGFHNYKKYHNQYTEWEICKCCKKRLITLNDLMKKWSRER